MKCSKAAIQAAATDMTTGMPPRLKPASVQIHPARRVFQPYLTRREQFAQIGDKNTQNGVCETASMRYIEGMR